LTQKKMAERDAFWSLEINRVADAHSHGIQRLIDWCLRTKGSGALRETLWLCALLLTWCFTTSNRQIRDRATKGLTALLLTQGDIFPKLVNVFQDVEDLYVAERLYAAAYGACCIDPSHKRLMVYAQATFETVFRRKVPPENLLLRDYARGILELSNHMGVLPKEVDIVRCRPPYGSGVPNFRISDAALQKIVDKAGDRTILSSCDHYGDFGQYAIGHSADKFVAVKLSSPPPYTSDEKFEQFEADVVRKSAKRVAAFEQLRSVGTSRFEILIQAYATRTKKFRKSTKAATERRIKQIREAENKFLALLGSDERKRYELEAKPQFNTQTNRQSADIAGIDLSGAKRWVAKKAYDFGWSKQLFQNDPGTQYDYQNERPLVERIGKKYQWLALSELLCNLSDNYWIGGRLGNGTRRYDNPTDLGFLRDIDPTILPLVNTAPQVQEQTEAWIFGPNITIPSTPEEELTDWPFRSDPGKSFSQLIFRVSPEGTKWIPLYDHRGVTTRYERAKRMEHGTRQQEFRLIFCVVVKQADRVGLI